MIAGIVPGQRLAACSTSRKPLAARLVPELALELGLFVFCLVAWQGVPVIDIDARRSHRAACSVLVEALVGPEKARQPESARQYPMNDLAQLWFVSPALVR